MKKVILSMIVALISLAALYNCTTKDQAPVPATKIKDFAIGNARISADNEGPTLSGPGLISIRVVSQTGKSKVKILSSGPNLGRVSVMPSDAYAALTGNDCIVRLSEKIMALTGSLGGNSNISEQQFRVLFEVIIDFLQCVINDRALQAQLGVSGSSLEELFEAIFIVNDDDDVDEEFEAE